MTQIKSTRNGKVAKVSPRLAKALVAGGKYTYLTREMRAAPAAAPQVQPVVMTADDAAQVEQVTYPPGTEISPITGKPKRQYRRRAVPSSEEE